MSTPIQRRVVHQSWAIKHIRHNNLDGYREWFEGDSASAAWRRLFRTRQEARAYNEQRHGYIRTRPDLRAEPHGWKMPKVVRVLVTIEEVP